jgi:hypothetical protein
MKPPTAPWVRIIRWMTISCFTILVFLGIGTQSTPRSSLLGNSPLIADAQTPGWTSFLPVVRGGAGSPAPLPPDAFVLLGWNDLGMHCYNFDFRYIGVLPPYNTLWAQVVKRGDPPQIVTKGIQVSYRFPDNTYSAGKSNFWTYAQKLFGLSSPLPANIGLTGKGLAGTMDIRTDPAKVNIDHFQADGIPLTEFSDSAPTTRQPYQLANLVANEISTGKQLASLTVVAPVSTEMHCDTCHANGKDPGGNTGVVELNILAKHDEEIGTNLRNSTPVLCASCHSSNALSAPGKPGIMSLSRAMHSLHAEEVPDTINGCYNCHPGPTTKCLRDVMSQTVTSKLDPNRKMNCIDCHGGMRKVASNPNPWLNEPRCDTCHTNVTQNNALYRFSTAHNGIYCEACHDSTHAIAPSSQANDAIKFNQLQGHGGPLDTCTVCHLTKPAGPFKH